MVPELSRRQALIGLGGLVGLGAVATIATVAAESHDSKGPPAVANQPGAESATGAPAQSPDTVVATALPYVRTAVLQDPAWLGIHYLPAPTITLEGASAVLNADPGVMVIGASAWQVFDLTGKVVGSGQMAKTASSIEVCTSGVWVGGAAAMAGFYTVATNAGAHNVVTGNVVICPADSRLYVPDPRGASQISAAAWIGSSADRDYYQIPPSLYGEVVPSLRADPYFSGPQDPARPHKVWVGPRSQAKAPTRDPKPADFAASASALVAAGRRGAWYECPTNEPEDGDWSTSDLISYWQACRSAIAAVDPSAHVMGYDSAGVFNGSSLSDVATFLRACPVAAFTNHMENSHENLSNIVALRQYFGALKSQFANSGLPNLDLWLTETGINGGLYGVLQPRRDARQRTVLRLVAESFGWAKENSYDFPIWDHHGSGITSYLIENNNSDEHPTGNLRAGAYALHVMAEALYGTSCTPPAPPARLSFGPDGSAGDSLFFGLHYRGARDVVVLATNGMESATVTLNVSTTGPVAYWDGMGVSRTLEVAAGRITVPLNDLLTYVFLPAGSTVSVASDWWTGAADILAGAAVMNESGKTVATINNGSFGENLQGDVPQVSAPYVDKKVPGTLKAVTTRSAAGFALMTTGPAWQNVGCSLVDFTIAVDGKPVYHYTCESAVSHYIPSASIGNNADPTPLTSWWTGPFAWLVKVPIPAGTVTLTINKASYGGQPDSLGSVSPGNPYHENEAPRILLAEWQLLA